MIQNVSDIELILTIYFFYLSMDVTSRILNSLSFLCCYLCAKNYDYSMTILQQMDIGVRLLRSSNTNENDSVENFSTVVEPRSERHKTNEVRRVNFKLNNDFPRCCSSHYLDSIQKNDHRPSNRDLIKRRLQIYFQQYPPRVKDAAKLYETENVCNYNEEGLSQVDLSEITVTELSSSESKDMSVKDFKFRDCRFCSRERPPRTAIPQPQFPKPKRRGQPLRGVIESPRFPMSYEMSSNNQKIISRIQSTVSENKTTPTVEKNRNSFKTGSSYYTPRSSYRMISGSSTARCASTGNLNNQNNSPTGVLKAAISFSDLVKRLEQLNCSNVRKKNTSENPQRVPDGESVEANESSPRNTSTDASSLSDIFLSDEIVKVKYPTPAVANNLKPPHASNTNKRSGFFKLGELITRVSGQGDSTTIPKSSETITPTLQDVSPLDFDLYRTKHAYSLKEKLKSISDRQSRQKIEFTAKSNSSSTGGFSLRKRSASTSTRDQVSSEQDSKILHRFWIPDVNNVRNTLVLKNDRRLSLTLSNYDCQARVMELENQKRGYPQSIIQIEAPSKQYLRWCSRAIDRVYPKWNLCAQLRCLR